jgi:hypothetical protein
MAPPKKPRSKLSRSAKYYRDNPEARKKKAETDKKVNARPEQKKKRREAGAARRKAKKAGKNLSGKDMSHTSSGMRTKPSKKNRGSRSDSPGDKRARGKRTQTKKK